MRAITFSTLKVSRATRAPMMLELSPLLTAANAAASLIPASIRVSRSNPIPPQPMITTCTVVLLSPGREPRFDATRQLAWGGAPYDRRCAAAGEADEPVPALLLVGRPLRSDRLGETFLPK